MHRPVRPRRARRIRRRWPALRYDQAEPGTELPPRQYQVTRRDLVRYAGASGDFNVIHWNERIARSVGLPDVIAHGMLTMALAGRFVTEWAGDPGAVTEFGGPVLRAGRRARRRQGRHGRGGRHRDRAARRHRVAVDVTARSDGAKVLTRARAVVRLP